MKDRATASAVNTTLGAHRADTYSIQSPRTTRGRHLNEVVTKATLKAEMHAHPMHKRDMIVALERVYRMPPRQPRSIHRLVPRT